MKALDKKGIPEGEILRLPCVLTDYKYKRGTQEREVVFTVHKEHLKYAHPLDYEMENHFVIFLVKIKDNSEIEEILNRGLEGINITP